MLARYAIIALLPLLFSFGTPLHLKAATISVFPLDAPSAAVIIVEGELLPNDSTQFRAKASLFQKAMVVFRSDGGNLFAGIEIGRIIRLRGFTTWVPSGVRCASACAAAWLGGSKRLMGRAALIGFHAAYRSDQGIPLESAPGNAVLGGYLRDIGLSDQAIIYITGTPPTSMTWLSLRDAAQLGIEVATFDPDIKSASPDDTSQQFSVRNQLEQKSKDFIVSLYQITSASNEQTIASIRPLYAFSVRYFDKQMSREEVITQVQRFIGRWPVRRYVPQIDSLTANCDENSLTCTITGRVQFDAWSLERNERSLGLAIFEYSLKFPSLNHTPQITAEGGAVLKREKGPLSSAANSPSWGHRATMSNHAVQPLYQLDSTQRRVLALSNLYPSSDCLFSQIDGRIVRRKFDEKNELIIKGVTIEESDGRRTYANVELNLENVTAARTGWVMLGLQTLLKEGNRVLLGVKLCGAAGRVVMVDTVQQIQ